MHITILESIENVFNMDVIFMEYGFPIHFFFIVLLSYIE